MESYTSVISAAVPSRSAVTYLILSEVHHNWPIFRVRVDKAAADLHPSVYMISIWMPGKKDH
jgi:hypothetical protein